MQSNPIPSATLAAGDQSDPAWWLACAEWHEQEAASEALEIKLAGQYHSAAALACRTFAAMMARAGDDVDWRVDMIGSGGQALWTLIWGGIGRSLPAAAVAALTEDD